MGLEVCMTLTTVNSLYTLGATASIDADESELSCHSHSHSHSPRIRIHGLEISRIRNTGYNLMFDIKRTFLLVNSSQRLHGEKEENH